MSLLAKAPGRPMFPGLWPRVRAHFVAQGAEGEMAHAAAMPAEAKLVGRNAFHVAAGDSQIL